MMGVTRRIDPLYQRRGNRTLRTLPYLREIKGQILVLAHVSRTQLDGGNTCELGYQPRVVGEILVAQ